MSDMIKIAVDAMGGDGSPKKIIDGIILNHSTNKNNFYKIFGDKIKIDPLIKGKIPVGFFEIILHQDNKEIEIAYFGILEEYQNNKLGSYLLSEAIKESFNKKNIERVWLHTCSLDHKNALNNYLARGMKIFKTEIINI